MNNNNKKVSYVNIDRLGNIALQSHVWNLTQIKVNYTSPRFVDALVTTVRSWVSLSMWGRVGNRKQMWGGLGRRAMNAGQRLSS